jgi:hypothetical protein
MAFTVHYSRGGEIGQDSYDDTHVFVVKDWGLLAVLLRGDEIQLYSPNFWTHVTPGANRRTLAGST